MSSVFGRMLSVDAIHFEDRLKDGTGGGGWVHRSGRQCMAAAAAGYRMGLVNAGWGICLPSCTNGHRKCSLHLVRIQFLAFFSPEERSVVGGP